METEENLQEPQSEDGGRKGKMPNKKKNRRKKKKNKNEKDKGVEEIIAEVRKSSNEESDTEEEDFWIPPAGERWDHDDGGDRWGSDSDTELEQETDEGDVIGKYVYSPIFTQLKCQMRFNIKVTYPVSSLAYYKMILGMINS